MNLLCFLFRPLSWRTALAGPGLIRLGLTRLGRVAAPVFMSLFLVACATASDPDMNDPYESFNRQMFGFNMSLDRHVLAPVARTYRDGLPDWSRAGIRNFLDNLQTPVILVNDLLQGEFTRADATFRRFLLNTLTGPAGLRDVARQEGLAGHGEDFGQTLAVWGVGSGPYLVLPFFGPSTPRDLFGRGVDTVFDPSFYVQWGGDWWIPTTRAGVDLIDSRSRTLDPLADLQRSSIDFYAAVRSLYTQSRESAISNGRVDVEKLPDF